MLALALAALSPASADPGLPYGNVLLGIGALPDSGEAANVRLGGRLGVPVAEGSVAGFHMILPAEVATSGNDGFGVYTRHTAFELAPSARVRFAPSSPVRVYGDAGIGFVHRFSRTETWFGDASNGRSAPMFRSALGLEFGGTGPGAVSVVVEPIGFRHYGLDGEGADMVTFLAGVQFGG